MSEMVGPAVMRANPEEPRRRRCEACGVEVLEVHVGGAPVLVEPDEVPAEGKRSDGLQAPAAGLYVAVPFDGPAASVRMPGTWPEGAALHRPHAAVCRP